MSGETTTTTETASTETTTPATTTETTTTTETATTEAAAAATETSGATETTETTTETTTTEKKPPAKPDELDTDILDLAKGEEELDEEKKAAEKAAADSYLKEAGFEEGIKAMSLGKGPDGDEMVMPAEDVGAVMAAMRRAGVPADKAKSMLATVGALDMVRAQRQAEQDRATLRAIREETRKEFGDGLRAAARNMQAGGVALFGAELWNDICTIPALVNDKRFVRALSAHGKTLRNDSGGPAPAPATGPTDGKLQFDLKSWMKGTQP